MASLVSSPATLAMLNELGPIQVLSASQIGQEKWDAFVTEAEVPNPFAQWQHLSAVCNGWGRNGWAIWVGTTALKDTSADPVSWDWAMPIPYRSGGWIKQITQPLFTQQLGILFRTGLPTSIKSAVLHAVLVRLSAEKSPLALAFSHANTTALPQANLQVQFPNLQLEWAPNVALDLNRPYQVILEGYSVNLIRKLKRQPAGQLVSYHQDNASWQLVIELFEQHINKQHKILSGRQLRRLARVCTSWSLQQQLIVSLLRSSNGELLAGIIYLCHQPIVQEGDAQPNRYVAFMGGATSQGKQQDSQVALMDANIQHWSANGGGIYDFEGSRLPGVQQLFKTFGPIEEPYLVVRK